MRDRNSTLDDLNKLRLWIESKPTVPEGDWYKDFGSFKLCGEGRYPKTFLLAGQTAKGKNFKFYQEAPINLLTLTGATSQERPQMRPFFSGSTDETRGVGGIILLTS